MKLPRAALAQWLSFDKENWTLLGRDTDSLSTELNPDVETTKNVQGDNNTNHNGFNPETAVDSYAARTEDSIYENLLDIVMNRKSDEESTKAYFLEAVLDEAVNISDNKTLTGKGWMEEVIVVPQSYGGDTSAFGIPFNLNPKGGERKEGTVSVTKRVPTFTPAAGGGSQPAAMNETQTKTSSKSLSD
ncbi:MAG: hypothetical protein K2N73_10525 [Lachnospiraceae bacterium]|nr:hypothetical protein [Lachnospiraceae bacterium]